MFLAQNIKHITIIGLGVMGASLAQRLKKKSGAYKITGVSSSSTLQLAIEQGLIDNSFEYGDNRAVEGSDLVFLCTPISSILKQLQAWEESPPNVERPCLIMDVGSTKKEICLAGEKAFDQHPLISFLGSHPMAGSEKSGLEARDPHLFENAAWILCPSQSSREAKEIQPFLEDLGARVSVILPDVHDKIAAHLSHLPQILATALAGHVSQNSFLMKNGLQISGMGFYDMTRLANSSLDMWASIFQTNKEQITAALEEYITYLKEMKSALAVDQLAPFFSAGRFLREKMVKESLLRQGTADILVTAPDRPHILESVVTTLSKNALNIIDLEILKVREGEGGTIKITFKKPEEAERAVEYLRKNNFEVQLKK